ncbi:hypothetical protein [Mesorhizobium sp. M0045]|uniref:hypothetical protein n=1 Tax=Mesorhizobium sp. M0045 TaxID=2956857 RepID=UPI00333B41F4
MPLATAKLSSSAGPNPAIARNRTGQNEGLDLVGLEAVAGDLAQGEFDGQGHFVGQATSEPRLSARARPAAATASAKRFGTVFSQSSTISGSMTAPHIAFCFC